MDHEQHDRDDECNKNRRAEGGETASTTPPPRELTTKDAVDDSTPTPADRDVDGTKTTMIDTDQTTPNVAPPGPTLSDSADDPTTANHDSFGTALPESAANDATSYSTTANKDAFGTAPSEPTANDATDGSTPANQDAFGTVPPEPTANDATGGSTGDNQGDQGDQGKKDKTNSGRRGNRHFTSANSKRVLKVGDKLVGPLCPQTVSRPYGPANTGPSSLPRNRAMPRPQLCQARKSPEASARR